MTSRSNWGTLCARVVWCVLVAVALCQSARASELRGTKAETVGQAALDNFTRLLNP